jgi:hypothetical protein
MPLSEVSSEVEGNLNIAAALKLRQYIYFLQRAVSEIETNKFTFLKQVILLLFYFKLKVTLFGSCNFYLTFYFVYLENLDFYCT